MNRETVHSVKEKNMYRNALQLNTDVKERTNEEGLMNHRKGGKEKRERERERKKSGNIKACMQLRFKNKTKQKKQKNRGMACLVAEFRSCVKVEVAVLDCPF